MKQRAIAIIVWAAFTLNAIAVTIPRGISTMTGPLADGNTPISLQSRTDIDGVSIGDRWNTIEPTSGLSQAGRYWENIDAEIVRVTAWPAPKWVLIRLLTSGGLPISLPEWARSQISAAGNSTFGGGTVTNGSTTISGNYTSGYTRAGSGVFKSCDYGKVVTGASIPAAGNQDFTITLVSGSDVLTFPAGSNLTVGDVGKAVSVVSGTGIPTGAVINGIDNGTTAHMADSTGRSVNATASGSRTVRITNRDTTIYTITNTTTVVLSRAATGTNSIFQVLGRNFISHNDHVQGVLTNVQVIQPLLWDPTFVSLKITLIQAEGDHITTGAGSSPALTTAEKANVKIVAVGYANTNTEDHAVLSGTSPDPPYPDTEANRMFAHGYTTALMIQCGKDIVGAAAAACPNQVITFALGDNGNLDAGNTGGDSDVKNYVDRQVMTWARATYPNQISIQKNNLAQKNAQPPYARGDAFYMIWQEGQGYSGEQMLWNSFSGPATPENSCRNSDTETLQGTFTTGTFNGTTLITSAQAGSALACKFSQLDTGKSITGTGIPNGTTIVRPDPALTSTVFYRNAAILSNATTGTPGSGKTFTIGGRQCDPFKTLHDALQVGIAKGDKIIEVYQPDCVSGENQTTLAHNTLVGPTPPPTPTPTPTPPPNGLITAPAGNVGIAAGDSVTFNGDGTDPSGLTLTYLWNFGTGSGIANSTAKNPGSKTFGTAGTFNVALTATNSAGISDPTPDNRTVTVSPSNPTPTPEPDKVSQILVVP